MLSKKRRKWNTCVCEYVTFTFLPTADGHLFCHSFQFPFSTRSVETLPHWFSHSADWCNARNYDPSPSRTCTLGSNCEVPTISWRSAYHEKLLFIQISWNPYFHGNPKSLKMFMLLNYKCTSIFKRIMLMCILENVLISLRVVAGPGNLGNDSEFSFWPEILQNFRRKIYQIISNITNFISRDIMQLKISLFSTLFLLSSFVILYFTRRIIQLNIKSVWN